jgi:hypothetical protein
VYYGSIVLNRNNQAGATKMNLQFLPQIPGHEHVLLPFYAYLIKVSNEREAHSIFKSEKALKRYLENPRGKRFLELVEEILETATAGNADADILRKFLEFIDPLIEV